MKPRNLPGLSALSATNEANFGLIGPCSGAEAVEDVAGDLLDVTVAFGEAPDPIGAARRDHGAAARCDERAEHGVAVGDPLDCGRVTGVEQP